MNIRFAVIDDAAFLREIIKNIMEGSGAQCVGEADDGGSGLHMVNRTLPDLVFLDMVMPHKNGIETAQAIKENRPGIKIVGCSTIDQESLVQKALDSGFDAYVPKPFTKEQLLQAVREVLPQLGEKSP